jgi:hypothetical protein
LATERFAAAGRAVPGLVDILMRNTPNDSAIAHLLSDSGGGELRKTDYEALENLNVAGIWRNMT